MDNHQLNSDISNTLSKFANSFDLKNWTDLQNTLDDVVECDYQDLRGKIDFISNVEYVKLRQQSLNHLKTQHLFSNLDITINKDTAHCQLNAIIFRKNELNQIFNTHAIYNFYLIRINKSWKINRIKQTVLWNEGDATIHQGVAPK